MIQKFSVKFCVILAYFGKVGFNLSFRKLCMNFTVNAIIFVICTGDKLSVWCFDREFVELKKKDIWGWEWGQISDLFSLRKGLVISRINIRTRYIDCCSFDMHITFCTCMLLPGTCTFILINQKKKLKKKI